MCVCVCYNEAVSINEVLLKYFMNTFSDTCFSIESAYTLLDILYSTFVLWEFAKIFMQLVPDCDHLHDLTLQMTCSIFKAEWIESHWNNLRAIRIMQSNRRDL